MINTGFLNILPKPHKLKHKVSPNKQYLLKSRPIVNGFNAVITQLSKLLSKFVETFLKKLRTSIEISYVLVNSSFEVVNQLNQLRIDPYDTQLHFVLFDLSSLYTSIDNNTVIDSFLFLRNHLDKDT